jgi:hypothetical protein
MKEKIYNSAPLPFQGQKRKFVKEFTKILITNRPPIVVDLFGGSGLLSHIAKRTLPMSKVVYNDFDDYHVRLKNVRKTNQLLSDIRDILKNYPDQTRIIGKERELIIERLNNEKGFMDWITLSSSLLFSMKYVLNFESFKLQAFYNNVKQTDYINDGYLDGITVVKSDYYNLYEQYKNYPGALFVIDPPYLSTDSSTYSSNEYWKLKDYLDVLRVLENIDYVFFTSNKSSIIELVEWVESTYKIISPFQGAILKTVGVQLNYNSRYTDMMLYRISKPCLGIAA